MKNDTDLRLKIPFENRRLSATLLSAAALSFCAQAVTAAETKVIAEINVTVAALAPQQNRMPVAKSQNQRCKTVSWRGHPGLLDVSADVKCTKVAKVKKKPKAAKKQNASNKGANQNKAIEKRDRVIADLRKNLKKQDLKKQELFEKLAAKNAKIQQKNEKLNELRGKIGTLFDKQKVLFGKMKQKNTKLDELRGKITSLREKTNYFRETSFELKKSEAITFEKLKTRFGKNWQGEKMEKLGFVVEDDRVVLSADLLFSPGKARIKKSAIPVLRVIGNKLNNMSKGFPDDQDWSFSIEGHADASRIRSRKYRSNLELSLARAQAVYRAVNGYKKLPRQRIALAGFGSSRPRVEGYSYQALKMNRRVEIRLINR